MNLGKANKRIRNIYVSDNISDGTNSVKVADIATKTDIPTVPTVVDTVADGNMNAVTSNAVYAIVGDVETLLAAI